MLRTVVAAVLTPPEKPAAASAAFSISKIHKQERSHTLHLRTQLMSPETLIAPPARQAIYSSHIKGKGKKNTFCISTKLSTFLSTSSNQLFYYCISMAKLSMSFLQFIQTTQQHITSLGRRINYCHKSAYNLTLEKFGPQNLGVIHCYFPSSIFLFIFTCQFIWLEDNHKISHQESKILNYNTI